MGRVGIELTTLALKATCSTNRATGPARRVSAEGAPFGEAIVYRT